jgi:hypothetical protein
MNEFSTIQEFGLYLPNLNLPAAISYTSALLDQRWHQMSADKLPNAAGAKTHCYCIVISLSQSRISSLCWNVVV